MRRENLIPAVLLGLVGLCCFPLGLASGIWGLIVLLAEKKAGRDIPILSIVCLVLFGLSIATNAGILVWAAQQNAEREGKKSAVTKKLEGKLEGATLEKGIACELAEQHLLKDKNYEWVKCEGTYVEGAVARLEVRSKFSGSEESSVFCFAKAHRWYVLMVPGDGKCPETAPSAGAEKPASLDDEENALRLEAETARAKALVAAFDERLQAVRKAVEVSHDEKSCSFKDEVKAAFVDYDALPGAEKPMKPWKVLTHADVKTALDAKRSAQDRGKAIDALGKVLVVFQSDEVKELPKATGNDFLMGEFKGWLSVVDLNSGLLLCEGPIAFESSETIGGGVRLKYAPKKSTQELADDDFEDKFEAAAKAAAQTLSGGKLKLRIGFGS